MNNLKALGFKNYKEYLTSDIWLWVRHCMLKEFDRCYTCNRKNTLQVHHKNYNRIGQEKSDDLLVLCKNCHTNLHPKEKDGKNT